MSSPPQLDHIVILVPHDQLAAPPSWVSDNFTVSPGGAHADGLTENVLILLSDGVYLELIAFTPTASAEKRARHRWGQLPYGIVDYAFTLRSSDAEDVDAEFAALQSGWKAAGVKDEYIPKSLVAGARRRPDGETLEWRVGNPEGSKTGIANFWCMDTTPRRLRVPLSDKATTHPSGVRGLQEVLVRAGAQDSADLEKLFGAYLSPENQWETAYVLGTPEGVRVQAPRPNTVRVEKGSRGEHEIVLVLHTEGERKVVSGEIGDRKVELRFE